MPLVLLYSSLLVLENLSDPCPPLLKQQRTQQGHFLLILQQASVDSNLINLGQLKIPKNEPKQKQQFIADLQLRILDNTRVVQLYMYFLNYLFFNLYSCC